MFLIGKVHTFTVLLDHGIYKELDPKFRLDYCKLWKALISLDVQKILELGEQFGVGKYAKYFPLIFTGRTIDRYTFFHFHYNAQILQCSVDFSHYGAKNMRELMFDVNRDNAYNTLIFLSNRMHVSPHSKQFGNYF